MPQGRVVCVHRAIVRLTIRLGLVVAVMMSAGPLDAAEPTPPKFVADEAGFKAYVQPFLVKHCERCHGDKKAEGEFRVDAVLARNFLDPVLKSRWGEVVNVLNSHEMPPESEPQPKPEAVAKVVDWVTAQMVKAEELQRDNSVVLRRLNRTEYRNTLRDLLGVDVDLAGFPSDPPAGGFDNNGRALTVSPLHMELFVDLARKTLDRAIVSGEKPRSISWRFEIETGNGDDNRKLYDKQNLIVNGGNNPVFEGKYKRVHHDNWDKKLNVRPFNVPADGLYRIRIRAAGLVPKREAVVTSAEKILADRLKKQMAENPKGERWHKGAYDRDLEHFRTDRMYDYGPPRIKVVQHLAGQPVTLTEFDVPATLDKPGEYDVLARFTTESAGITLEYAYSIPRVLENFWMQTGEEFARPELYVDWFEIEGPILPEWPPASHVALVGKTPPAKSAEKQAAKTLLSKFMRKAYRRPVTPAEVEEKLSLFDSVRADKPSYAEAVKIPLIAVLASPHFLYLTEPSDAKSEKAGRRKLTDHELASRLAYFLWSSTPDEALLAAADRGELRDAKKLRTQVDRLLKDDRSDQLVRNFTGQWLGLREVGANPPAADLYPQYDRHLEVSMVQESESFFEEVLRSNVSVMNLIRSDFVVINERLARFYGIPDVRGDEFRRVTVPKGVERGGVPTQASILVITSNGTRTSPVKRGTWILKNLLGTDPGLPVANAGDIAPKVPGIDKATVRKRLEIHRELPQCARCHSKIDPLGFALENYNACGEYRLQEGFGYKGRIERDDPKIDAGSRLPDGTEVVGVAGLQRALMEREDLFLGCLSQKLLTYALGRELGVADRPAVQAAVKHLKSNRYELDELIQFIAASEAFQTK
jgi:hypothetical protein